MPIHRWGDIPYQGKQLQAPFRPAKIAPPATPCNGAVIKAATEVSKNERNLENNFKRVRFSVIVPVSTNTKIEFSWARIGFATQCQAKNWVRRG